MAAATAGLAATLVLAATPVAAGPLDELVGYWSGAGTIVLNGGSRERVKCAVIYKVDAGGSHIKQTTRCASADYKISGKADLRVKGDRVEGSWEETTYSATGQVTGRYTGRSFALTISGANFSAAMNIGLSRCNQSIQIAPKGLEVKRISMALSKC
jgi:hypothetical protein